MCVCEGLFVVKFNQELVSDAQELSTVNNKKHWAGIALRCSKQTISKYKLVSIIYSVQQ